MGMIDRDIRPATDSELLDIYSRTIADAVDLVGLQSAALGGSAGRAVTDRVSPFRQTV